MNEKVKKALDGVVELFQKPDELPKAIAYAVNPTVDIPSAKWSFQNRVLMWIAGTNDGRGYKQWKEAGRQVKKDTKAFHILAPSFARIEEDDGTEARKLVGFRAIPIFKVEDTEGEPLEYENINIPDLPLMEKAKEWGLGVKAVPGNVGYYGSFNPRTNGIELATPEEKTFFHELSHAAHNKVVNGLKMGQDSFQEIVAELSAQVLCQLVGKKSESTLGNSFAYIQRYASQKGWTVVKACQTVLEHTEKTLNLIME